MKTPTKIVDDNNLIGSDDKSGYDNKLQLGNKEESKKGEKSNGKQDSKTNREATIAAKTSIDETKEEIDGSKNRVTTCCY